MLGTARAERSVPSARHADLPLTAGEHLDVIDTVQGHAVICRNAQGRCESATPPLGDKSPPKPNPSLLSHLLY